MKKSLRAMWLFVIRYLISEVMLEEIVLQVKC